MTVIHWLANCWPRPVRTDLELEAAIDFLDIDVTPSTVARAGYGCALWLLVGAGAVALWWGPLALAVGSFLAAGIASGTPELAKILATARRNEALGTAPDLVNYAVLRATLEPNTESAAVFAADTGSGMLAKSLHTSDGHRGRVPRVFSHLVRSGASGFRPSNGRSRWSRPPATHHRTPGPARSNGPAPRSSRVSAIVRRDS